MSTIQNVWPTTLSHWLTVFDSYWKPPGVLQSSSAPAELVRRADDKRLDEWVSEDKVLQPDTRLGSTDALSPHVFEG